MQCSVCAKPETKAAKLKLCARCKSAPYCSAECQRADWNEHKKFCKLLNQGIAGQLSIQEHQENSGRIKKRASLSEFLSVSPTRKRIWELFENKAGQPDATVIREMKNIFFCMPQDCRDALMVALIPVLAHSNIETIKKSTSPLLVLLQNNFVDPNYGSSQKYTTTALHMIAMSADNVLNMENQVILGQQLIDAGADVNKKSYETDNTPLHIACASIIISNLDFIKLLLDNGADPNVQDSGGSTPLMVSLPEAVAAAKFVVDYNGPVNVDLNVRAEHDGNVITLLELVRLCVTKKRMDLTRLSSPEGSGDEEVRRRQYQLRQLEEFEQVIVAKGGI